MKKTTLFLFSLFLTIGAMAQIRADKVYTVVAVSHKNVTQPAWAVNNEKTAFVSTGNTTIGDETQKHFAFIEFNNVTYIYSVFAKKFIKNDGTLVAGVPQAVTVQELDGGKYLFKFDNEHFINIGGVGQMTIDGWGDQAGEVDGGNTMTLTEVGEFSVEDLYEATALLYTPNHTGAKSNTDRKVGSFSVNDDTYTLTDEEQLQNYVDKTNKIFTVEPGSEVALAMTQSAGHWMNAFVYVDADKNGFSAGITNNYVPTGDLVSYSFYNNGASSDAAGWNSAGTPISGDVDRNTLYLPSFTAPSKAGTYRIRAKYDWCNINPAGDTGRYFNNTYTGHGAAIIDFTLVVKDVDKSALQNFIAEAETLLAKVADYFTDEGDGINISGKISSNAAQNPSDGNAYNAALDGAGIAGLTDNNVNTYFHSRWSGNTIDEDHYLQIDLGEGNTLSDFCFSYSVRKGENTTLTSPAPTAIEVRVSEDGNDFGNTVATFTKGGNNLPSYTDLGATTWHSGVIKAGKDIRYIRLTVTESAGPLNTQWEGHYFFAMSALNLYKTKQVPAVKDAYKDVITAEQMNMVAEALADANTVNNNNVASSAQVNTAASELDVALEPLRTAAKRYTLSVSAAGWASLYLDFPAEIPYFGNEDEEAGVYIVTGVKEGNWLNLVKVTDGVLPANTGVIVKAAQGTYEFKYSAEDAADVSDNILKGTVKDEYIEGKAYVLGNKSGIGFYQALLNFNATYNKITNEADIEQYGVYFKNNAYKSYLLATDIPAMLSRSAGFRFSFGGTTVIEEVEVENEKVNEAIYDLAGRRLNEITKPGIYIINGKKNIIR